MRQPTDFTLKTLKIRTPSGDIDIGAVMEELNIFDNLFLPCMSGSVVIRDALGIINRLKFDGDEYIDIEIEKETGSRIFNKFKFKKTFRIEKISNRTNTNSRSEIYALHFVAKELLISEKSKVQNIFRQTTYSAMAETVMKQHLGLKKQKPDIDYIHDSIKNFDIAVPSLTPFETLDWLARRALFKETLKPDFVFYQTQYGYSFASLSALMKPKPQTSIFTINTTAKDVENTLGNEILGSRDLVILSYGEIKDAIQQGIYGGTFIGFDTLCRVWQEKTHTFNSLYKPTLPHHLNAHPNVPMNSQVPEGSVNGAFSKSRLVAYPYELPRQTNPWILAKDPRRATVKDNQEEYVFQRRHIFGHLAQKRLQLTMAGNFGLYSGEQVEIEIPKFSQFIKSGSSSILDPYLSGRYLISGVRHVLKYDRHETLIEVCSDSNKEPK